MPTPLTSAFVSYIKGRNRRPEGTENFNYMFFFTPFSFHTPQGQRLGHPPLHFCFTLPFSRGRTHALGKNKQEGPELPLVLTTAVPQSQQSQILPRARTTNLQTEETAGTQ